MNKFFALYINEITKISRKISVIVILSIMTVSVIGIGGLMKIQQIAMERFDTGMPREPEEWRIEEGKREMEFLKKELEDINRSIDQTEDYDELLFLYQRKHNIESRVEFLELSMEMGIPIYGQGYKSEIINELVNISTEIKNYEALYDDEMPSEIKEEYENLKKTEKEYLRIIEESDFAAYIGLQKEKIDRDVTLTDEEKSIKKEIKGIWLKADPDGSISEKEGYNPLGRQLDNIENNKMALLNNIEYSYGWQGITAKPLTPERRSELENETAVLVYSLENGIYGTDFSSPAYIAETAMSAMFTIGAFFVTILILVLAGGSVSQEISSGSIKSLIISPTKRYKIFFAKIASILSVGIAGTLFLYFVTIPVHGLLFGFSDLNPYVYAIDGVAGELHAFIYRLGYLFVEFIDVIVYMAFAVMLSVITRNTAISVGVSIAVFFGGNTVNQIVSIFTRGEWMKFIPFNNMSLGSRVFPTPADDMGMNIFFGNQFITPSLNFSLVYLTVLIICMGYIALDSFNRRDIK